jgi:hypothetical protein
MYLATDNTDYLWLFVLRYAATCMIRTQIPESSNIGIHPLGATSRRIIQASIKPDPMTHQNIRESRSACNRHHEPSIRIADFSDRSRASYEDD